MKSKKLSGNNGLAVMYLPVVEVNSINHYYQCYCAGTLSSGAVRMGSSGGGQSLCCRGSHFRSCILTSSSGVPNPGI